MEVTKWTRFGHRRLYVKDDAGNAMGWWDLTEHQAHPVAPEFQDVIREAAASWGCREAASAAVVEAEPSSPKTPVRVRPPLDDLGDNVAGQQLQQQISDAHENGEKPTLLRRFFLGKDAWSTWERGAIGERLVEAELVKLEEKCPGWTHLNSIPVGIHGSDIDHLLIGPGGVFTINAKNHQGCQVWVGGDIMMVNGQRVHHVRNARHEAARAARLLTQAVGFEVPVAGWVVTVRCELKVKKQPEDVHVMGRRDLMRYARRQPVRLTPEQVDFVMSRARVGNTWAS